MYKYGNNVMQVIDVEVLNDGRRVVDVKTQTIISPSLDSLGTAIYTKMTLQAADEYVTFHTEETGPHFDWFMDFVDNIVDLVKDAIDALFGSVTIYFQYLCMSHYIRRDYSKRCLPSHYILSSYYNAYKIAYSNRPIN